MNAAGGKMKSTNDELTVIYKEYTNKKEYKADFYDITQGDSRTARWAGTFVPESARHARTRENSSYRYTMLG